MAECYESPIDKCISTPAVQHAGYVHESVNNPKAINKNDRTFTEKDVTTSTIAQDESDDHDVEVVCMGECMGRGEV